MSDAPARGDQPPILYLHAIDRSYRQGAATLAQLVRLSPYYFCRAFKQSFSIPPHRYHTGQRIERAKTLLAKSDPSVTDIGFAVGFSQTSSFTAAFRKATGLTPTAYHRSRS